MARGWREVLTLGYDLGLLRHHVPQGDEHTWVQLGFPGQCGLGQWAGTFVRVTLTRVLPIQPSSPLD